MAAPVLGGLLVADEVIDLLLPVIFNWYQVRRWRKLHQKETKWLRCRSAARWPQPEHEARCPGAPSVSQ